MKYPLSVLDTSADLAFKSVLYHHLPNGGKVLDLTYGTGISWGQPGLLDDGIELTASDINPAPGTPAVKQDLFYATDRPEWQRAFDLVYYDPPWFVDIESESDDPRASAYGGYGAQGTPLMLYMGAVHSFPGLLKTKGKIIVKCSDQYHVKSRKLLLHHAEWIGVMTAMFNVVDFYIYRYHRMSPTAFQVKDRPCGVIVHSYFIVGQLKD